MSLDKKYQSLNFSIRKKNEPVFRSYPLETDILFMIGFPGSLGGKEPTHSAGDSGSLPGVDKIPWRRERQPTPVFLPGESHVRGAWQAIVHERK